MMSKEFEFKQRMKHLIEKAQVDLNLMQQELDEFRKHIGMI